ncbi:phosphoribosylformylglycinamidine synthase subunit PurQ, partial [Candidatus Peregrinibacteria bacterium]|nr:phosphoribosylformylglycinamidine synthase subunit PurQ [Candidatus Peregrinibacteria bacterium]
VPEESQSIGVALSVDGNPRYGQIDPYWQASNAVVEGCRNVAAVGATPWCITDCLNYGNPEKPEQMWEFAEGVKGISDALRGIGLLGFEIPAPKEKKKGKENSLQKPVKRPPLPCISGNVSLYNISEKKSIAPQAIIATLGRLENANRAVAMQLTASGNQLFLVGPRKDELGGSAYYDLFGELGANVPKPDFKQAAEEIRLVTKLIQEGAVESCHDISDGGLAVAIAEMCIGHRADGRVGAKIDISRIADRHAEKTLRTDKKLFSETGGFVLEISRKNAGKAKKIAIELGVPLIRLGFTVRKPHFVVFDLGSEVLKLKLGALRQDRGRAGIIASLDPVMKTIKAEAEKGKAVLGICNGAQILVEAGLIPGADGLKLAMALARNKRLQNGEVLGVGYYNAWTRFKCVAPAKSTIFTWNMEEGEILQAPVAHGEGRFTTELTDLMEQLQKNGQMIFRYCDENGAMTENFPTNPNGAMFNLAAVCNPAGNVMGVMPHLERSLPASAKLFSSIRDGLAARKSGGLEHKRTRHLPVKPLQTWPLPEYQLQKGASEWLISLIITDNEAETFEMTLNEMGWNNITLARSTHLEIEMEKRSGDAAKTMRKMIQSGVLLNTNKEKVRVSRGKENLLYDSRKEKFTAVPPRTREENSFVFPLLVREKADYAGLAKVATFQKRLKMPGIKNIHIGTLWEIRISTKSKNAAENTLKKIMATHLFFNPHRQSATLAKIL